MGLKIATRLHRVMTASSEYSPKLQAPKQELPPPAVPAWASTTDKPFSIRQADTFLAMLGPAPYCFQMYSDIRGDDPLRGYRTMVRRDMSGTLAEHLDRITVNQREKRHAIGVAVHDVDGDERTTDNIARPRCIFADLDVDGKVNLAKLLALKIKPTMVVESSVGKFQVYYRCDDLTWSQYEGIAARLVRDFGADPKAVLRTQVGRLPGFYHLKDMANPFLVRIAWEVMPSGTLTHVHAACDLLAQFVPVEGSISQRAQLPASKVTIGAALRARMRAVIRPFAPEPQAAESAPEPARQAVREAPTTVEHTPPRAAAPDPFVISEVAAALRSIDARQSATGPFAIVDKRSPTGTRMIDTNDYDWYVRIGMMLHQASGGSESALKLWATYSDGDRALGFVGCGSKNGDDREAKWASFGRVEKANPLTIRTLFYIAIEYCGYVAPARKSRRAQRRFTATPQTEQLVALMRSRGEAIANFGIEEFADLHRAQGGLTKGTLAQRFVELAYRRLNRKTGMADFFGLTEASASLETTAAALKHCIRALVAEGSLLKSSGTPHRIYGRQSMVIVPVLADRHYDHYEQVVDLVDMGSNYTQDGNQCSKGTTPISSHTFLSPPSPLEFPESHPWTLETLAASGVAPFSTGTDPDVGDVLERIRLHLGVDRLHGIMKHLGSLTAMGMHPEDLAALLLDLLRKAVTSVSFGFHRQAQSKALQAHNGFGDSAEQRKADMQNHVGIPFSGIQTEWLGSLQAKLVTALRVAVKRSQQTLLENSTRSASP